MTKNKKSPKVSLRNQFVDRYAPEQLDRVHPDLCAVRVDDNPEYLGWVDNCVEWNGHILQPGTWLFPSGEIIELTR